jgi:hypothetical protein
MQPHDRRQLAHEDANARILRETLRDKPGVPDIEELQAQVALVKAKTRPWKSIIALVLAIAAAGASSWAHSYFRHYTFNGNTGLSQLIAAATAVGFCLFASVAVAGLASKARSVLEPLIGISHAAVIRYTLVLVGIIVVLIITLVLFGVQVGQLILGGALTTVFVSIAAQQALGNVFSGLVLLLARPFNVGDAIRLRAGALSGEIDGTVTEIGITYLRLSTSDGDISIPNSQVLNAVVGPLPAGDYPAPPAPPPPPIWPAPPVPGVVAPAGPGAAYPGTAAAGAGSADGASAGPVGTADGAGGAPRPGTGGEQ